MPQRVIKIILPENHGEQALELLEHQDNLIFWLEESSGSNFVASALTDSGRSETIMDLFEKIFSSVEGFRLILFPVEASIPRTDTDGEDVSASSHDKTKTDQKIAKMAQRPLVTLKIPPKKKEFTRPGDSNE